MTDPEPKHPDGVTTGPLVDALALANLYLGALALAYLAADPNAPANTDGSGEWSIDDVEPAVKHAINNANTAAQGYSELLAESRAEQVVLRAEIELLRAQALG